MKTTNEKYEKNFIFLFLLIFFYIFYILYTIFSLDVVLADDLIMIYSGKNIDQNFFEYIVSFVDSSTMSARPVSGFITGTIVFLSKSNDSIYFSGLVFFPLSILTIYFVLNKILPKEIACLVILFYSVSLIGTSIQFSPIMLNSNLATIFYALSIYFIAVKKNLVASTFLFILSILSYEIFFIGIIINILLIKGNKNKIFYAVFTLGLIFLYRKCIQSYFLVNSYERDSFSNVFNMDRNFKVFLWSLKIIFRDYFVAVFKSIANLWKINLFEWMMALLTSFGVFKILTYFDFNSHSEKVKKVAVVSFLGFIISFGIFIFSTYKPSLFGFENRNLGAVRLFSTLSIICFAIYIARKSVLKKNIAVMIFSIAAFILVITNLGIKNSWIYANDFNNEVFKQIKTELDENKIQNGTICVDFDVYNELENNPNFILREPVFFNNWESNELAFRNGIDENKIRVQNLARDQDCNYTIFIKKDKIPKE